MGQLTPPSRLRADKGLRKAAETVKGMTEGRGADYCFESTAVPELGDAPLAFVRNAGTAVQMSGIEQPVEMDMTLFEWNKKYINPLYGECSPDIDFPKIFSLYEKGDMMPDQMITRTYKLEELQQGF